MSEARREPTPPRTVTVGVGRNALVLKHGQGTDLSFFNLNLRTP